MKPILLLSHEVANHKNSISRLEEEYEVDAIGYMQTALYKIRKEKKYDLVIIEIMMPPSEVYTLEETREGMITGIVFYERALRQLNIPVIFWSWSDQFIDEINRLEGKVTFVKKEIDHEHLLLAVKKFVGKL